MTSTLFIQWKSDPCPYLIFFLCPLYLLPLHGPYYKHLISPPTMVTETAAQKCKHSQIGAQLPIGLSVSKLVPCSSHGSRYPGYSVMLLGRFQTSLDMNLGFPVSLSPFACKTGSNLCFPGIAGRDNSMKSPMHGVCKVTQNLIFCNSIL